MSVQTSFSDTPAIAFAGMLADGAENDLITLLNAESSASMAFGSAVAFKPSGTYDSDGTVPANSTDKIAGILVHSHAHARQVSLVGTDGNTTTMGDLSTTGVAPGGKLDILRKGRVWITTVTACVPGDRGYVSYNGTGTATAAGLVAQTSDSSHTIDSTSQIVYLTSASANGLAMIEVDFTNKP